MAKVSAVPAGGISGKPLKWLNKAVIYVVVTFLAAVILVPFFGWFRRPCRPKGIFSPGRRSGFPIRRSGTISGRPGWRCLLTATCSTRFLS